MRPLDLKMGWVGPPLRLANRSSRGPPLNRFWRLSGLLSFRKYGELWLSYRATEELLKQEKYLFLTQAGRYADSQSPFKDFAATIEGIISGEHSKFIAMIEEARRPTKSGNQ